MHILFTTNVLICKFISQSYDDLFQKILENKYKFKIDEYLLNTKESMKKL